MKKKKLALNFKELDAMVKFHYKDDLIKAIEGYEYKYVSHYVHDMYYRHKYPGAKIAKNLPITTSAVFAWMRQWGFAPRERGGNTKNQALQDPKVLKKIMDCKGTLSILETAEKCGCSFTTVLKLWKQEGK